MLHISRGKRNFLQNNQFLGTGGQIFVAILGVNDAILNADAEFAGQVDAGLGGCDGVQGHGLVVLAGGAGNVAAVDFPLPAGPSIVIIID